MPAADKQAFVESLAREHGARLRRFLASRLRYAASDVPDLVQEVYLRLLRIPRQESIRSPQAYMFTIAFHVLHQHKLALADAPEAVDPMDLPTEFDASGPDNDPATRLETRERLGQLEVALRELPPNAHASFVLHRRYGFTLEEIAEQLGVSRAMVKKYLARAVAHCRERFEEFKSAKDAS
jgi:RNA polymerase sigma-70 factor (ECF subfamily)